PTAENLILYLPAPGWSNLYSPSSLDMLIFTTEESAAFTRITVADARGCPLPSTFPDIYFSCWAKTGTVTISTANKVNSCFIVLCFDWYFLKIGTMLSNVQCINRNG